MRTHRHAHHSDAVSPRLGEGISIASFTTDVYTSHTARRNRGCWLKLGRYVIDYDECRSQLAVVMEGTE
jgi:hypothetical protein